MAQRVLIKISGEALSDKERPLANQTIEQTALLLKTLQDQGVEIGVVVGGGNILRGRNAAGMERNRADHMGMLATAVNALALQDALERLGAPCSVLSAVSMNRFCDEYTARGAMELLSAGRIVIFACGTGSPFFSTDTAAALRAAEVSADVLLLAKNIDGVYSADPAQDPNAVKYDRLTYDEVIKQNLKATDITAITLCRERGLPIRVFALSDLPKILAGESVGTQITE